MTVVTNTAANRPATIYDVAAAAGVSPSTVSRAFSRPGRVSSKTAARIHKVAAEIGYRSEQEMRAQASGKTKLLGVVVSDVTNPFFFSIIRGAERVVVEAGYSIMLADSEQSSDREREWLERTLPSLEGMIVASSRLSDTALRGVAKTVPVAVLNRLVSGLPCVVTDNARGMRRALEHLTEFGHRRIGYIAGPAASWSDGARWRAFRECCYELDLLDYRVGPTPPTVRGGMNAFASLHERNVTAVIAYNDLIGIGLMRAARDAGLQVPRDLSVIGFDNIFASDLVTPGLTTVAAPLSLLGERAARTVVSMITHNEQLSEPNPVVLPMKLIVRESTAPARRRTA